MEIMSNPSIYEFCGNSIRTITDSYGSLWWCLKDLVNALNLDATTTEYWLFLEPHEKSNKAFLSSEGRQYLRMINHDGLFRLLVDSPVADAFIRWEDDTIVNFSNPAGKKEIFHKQMENLLTPTKIGMLIGGLSAQRVNQILEDIGMQRSLMDFDKRRYLLTDVGKAFGVMTTVVKNNGEDVSSVMWREPIVNLVAARLREENRDI